jgi:acyl-coenzyme A thioesterase 13
VDEAKARFAFEQALSSYKQEFNTFFLARFFGMEISYGVDSCTVTMPIHDYMFNPQGSLHGGVTATALDISMGHLLKHVVGPGATLAFSAQYLRGLREGTLRAQGRFTRRGRSICFMESQAFDESGDLVGIGSSTWKVL